MKSSVILWSALFLLTFSFSVEAEAQVTPEPRQKPVVHCKCSGLVTYFIQGIARGTLDVMYPLSERIHLDLDNMEDCLNEAEEICRRRCRNPFHVHSALQGVLHGFRRIKPTGGKAQCHQRGLVREIDFEYGRRTYVDAPKSQEFKVLAPDNLEKKERDWVPVLVGVGGGALMVVSYLTGVGEVATAAAAVVLACAGGMAVEPVSEVRSSDSLEEIQSQFECENAEEPDAFMIPKERR